MTSPRILHSAAGFVTFDILRADDVEAARILVDTLTSEVRDTMSHAEGFVSSRIHLSLDGATMVHRGEWTGRAECENYLPTASRGVVAGFSDRSGASRVTRFGGVPAPGIEGPATTEPPGLVAVATRHVGNHESARALGELLLQTGQWKKHCPGFISAMPYISLDGATYINYPQWVDEAAYHSYMADPRISEGQEVIARLEVAPPEFVLCAVVAEITAPRPVNDIDWRVPE